MHLSNYNNISFNNIVNIYLFNDKSTVVDSIVDYRKLNPNNYTGFMLVSYDKHNKITFKFILSNSQYHNYLDSFPEDKIVLNMYAISFPKEDTEKYLHEFKAIYIKHINGLDQNEYNKMMDKYPQFEEIFELLYKNTQYFTTKQVLKSLELNINKWESERKDNKLYVVLSLNKNYKGEVGSEEYFYHKFKHLLPYHDLLLFDHNNLPNKTIDKDAEYLFLDDWSLSGTNLSGNIDRLTQMYKIQNYLIRDGLFVEDWKLSDFDILEYISKLKSTQEFLESKREDNFEITVILSIITETAKEIIEDMADNIYYTYMVPNLGDILRENNIDEELINDFSLEFSPDIESTSFPIHLEYKIANQFGSYPTIYEHSRLVKPDKSFMREIVPLDSSKW